MVIPEEREGKLEVDPSLETDVMTSRANTRQGGTQALRSKGKVGSHVNVES